MNQYFHVKLHTAGKTDEQILAESPGWGLNQADIDQIRAAKNAWDGLECAVCKYEFSENYYFYGSFEAETEAKVKEAIYLMEQDAAFGSYINDRERFERDWGNAEYESEFSITFKEADVEILAELHKTGKGESEA